MTPGLKEPQYRISNPEPQHRVRITDPYYLGVTEVTQGHWEEVMNTDSEVYGGGNRGNLGGVASQPEPADGQDHSVQLALPPLSVVVLRLRT